ncbi:hypothetical protein AURDEDRAFT_152801 [Auricularia subglabra TFB-10046 SS5]|nr:hypothetical protein AURDEDRAFT_152801 [Auricularia subglabra TFB-10046 SS5]
MADNLVEDIVIGPGPRRATPMPDLPVPGSSADMAIDVDDFVPPPRPVRPLPRGQAARRALTPPLGNVPREPIVLSDSDDDDGAAPFDPEAAHDEIMFGAGAAPGPSRPRRPQHPRPQRRALFSPPPPVPHPGPPPPPVPAIPERLRNLRANLHNLFMHPLEELGDIPLPRFGGLFQHVPHLPAPNPFPPPPQQQPPQEQQQQRQPTLGLGGYILRQAAQNFGRNGRNIRFTFDFGVPGLGLVDADGWQRYDEQLFEQVDRAAAPPTPQYKREYLFKEPLAAGFTSDFAPPEPPPAPKVFDVETGEEVIDKGKGKAEAPQRLLVCAKCVDPLRADQNARERRVWALRCGHVLDGRCLAAVSEDPETEKAFAPSVAAPAVESAAGPARTTKQTARRGKGRGAVRGRKPVAQPPPEPETVVLAEREWACPVPRCGKAHWSQLVRKGEHAAPTWVQKPGCGAIQVFV